MIFKILYVLLGGNEYLGCLKFFEFRKVGFDVIYSLLFYGFICCNFKLNVFIGILCICIRISLERIYYVFIDWKIFGVVIIIIVS